MSNGITAKGIAQGLVVNGLSLGKGKLQAQREGGFRVQAIDLATAEQFAGQNLVKKLGNSDYAQNVHFTVRGRELSRFERKPWLALSDFLKDAAPTLSTDQNGRALAYEDKIVMGILAITFGGLSVLFGWAPVGIVFSIPATVFTILTWKQKNNHLLSIIGTILTVIGLIISLIMTFVWFFVIW